MDHRNQSSGSLRQSPIGDGVLKADQIVAHMTSTDFGSIDEFVFHYKSKYSCDSHSLLKLLYLVASEIKGMKSISSLYSLLSTSENCLNVVEKVVDVASNLLSSEQIFLFQFDPDNEDLMVTNGSSVLLGKRMSLKNGHSLSLESIRLQLIQFIDSSLGNVTKTLILSPVTCNNTLRGYLLARNKVNNNKISPRECSFSDVDESTIGYLGVFIGIVFKLFTPSFTSTQWSEPRLLDRSDVDNEIQSILWDAYKKTDADRISLFVYNDTTKTLKCIVSQDILGYEISSDVGLAGSAFQSGAVINIPETSEDERHCDYIDNKLGYRTTSLLCIPVVDENGCAVGVVQAINKKTGQHFTVEDECLVMELGKKIMSIIQKKDQTALLMQQYNEKKSSVLLTSSLRMMSCSTLRQLSVETVDAVNSLTDCDYVGLYSLENDTNGSQFLQLIGDGQNREILVFPHRARQRTSSHSSPTLVRSSKIPPDILAAIRSNCGITEFSDDSTSHDVATNEFLSEFLFLPGSSLKHVLFSPIALGQSNASPSSVVSRLSTREDSGFISCGPDYAASTCRSTSTHRTGSSSSLGGTFRTLVLIACRDHKFPKFSPQDIKQMELLSSIINSAAENIMSTAVKEAAAKSLETTFHIVNSTLFASSDMIMIAGPTGQVLVANEALEKFISLHPSADGSQTQRANYTGVNYAEWFDSSQCPELHQSIDSVLRNHQKIDMKYVSFRFLSSSGVQSNAHIDFSVFAIGVDGVIDSNSMDNQQTQRTDNLAGNSAGNSSKDGRKDGILAVVAILKQLSPATAMRRFSKNTNSVSSPVAAAICHHEEHTASGVAHAAASLLDGCNLEFQISDAAQTELDQVMTALSKLSSRLRAEETVAERSPQVGSSVVEREGDLSEENNSKIGGMMAVPTLRDLDRMERKSPAILPGGLAGARAESLRGFVDVPSTPLIAADFVEPVDLHSWNFCTMYIPEKSSLCSVVGKIYDVCVDLSELGIDATTLGKYISVISQNYRDENPFHNFQHATNVVHFAYKLVCSINAQEFLPKVKVFGILLSALVHDVAHPGNTNAFEVNCCSELALRYNDQSVLENHHCSTAFRLMRKPGLNLMNGMKTLIANDLRKTIISSVLATDMAVHFQLMEETKKFSVQASQCESTAQMFTDAADQMFLCKLLVHAADLSNPVREFSATKMWAERISAEFNAQVTKEEELGLPVLSFMVTKDEKALCKNEIGFSSFVVGPLWRSMATFLPSLNPLVLQLDNNLTEWKCLLERIESQEDEQEDEEELAAIN